MGHGYRKPPILFDGMIDVGFTAMRALTAFALTAFPLGALLEIFDDGPLGGILGNLLSAAAIFAMFAVISARPSRILGNESYGLDEYELSYRFRAMAAAYQALASLLLLFVVYAYFALEFGLPLPREKETWQALATGAIVATFVLPSAFLVWVYEYDEASIDADGEQAAA